MAIKATDTTDFERPADGVHEATFDGYELEETGPYGPSVKLVWKLTDGTEKWQWVGQKLGIKAKLREIVTLLGGEVKAGNFYEVSDLLDPLVGTPVKLYLKTNEEDKQKVLDVMKSGAAPVAAADGIGDCFICRKPGSRYDGEGRVVCEPHASIK